MSGPVGSAISKSGMVENVGVDVGIASPSASIQKLFPLPVFTSGFVADVVGFRCWPMWGNVGRVIFRPGMVENVGVAVGIASPFLSVQKLFLLPVYSLSFCVRDVEQCWAMSSVLHLSRA